MRFCVPTQLSSAGGSFPYLPGVSHRQNHALANVNFALCLNRPLMYQSHWDKFDFLRCTSKASVLGELTVH